jgi:hypothetical protein
MIAKYNIEYAIPFHGRDHRHEQTQHYHTDDPVTCEEFLSELLERGITINSVSHEGVTLPKIDFDKMIKTAAGMLATRHICRSLGVDSVEAHHRFGSPA